jgi:hypothetical protein
VTGDPAPSSELKTSGRAIASLALGILGVTLVPLIPAIMAVVFGMQARTEIRAEPERWKGEGVAMAGLVLGWCGAGVVLLLGLVYLLEKLIF